MRTAFKSLTACILSMFVCLANPAQSLATEFTTEGAFPEPASEPALIAQSEPVLEAASATWTRLSGENRYDTMAAIASEGFMASEWAIVATGNNFPDALGASSLAGALDCPIILTERDVLSDQAADTLTKLGVQHAYLVGGTSVLSEDVEQQVESLGIDTHRFEGANRYETNAQIFAAARAWGYPTTTAIVTSGSSFADALSIGPWAYHTSTPIAITYANGLLSDEAVRAIQQFDEITNILIVGGESAVSDQISEQLGDGYTYDRISGTNRYETSKAVAAWEVLNGFSWSSPAVTTGANFPDALAGATLCGRVESVLLLGSKVTDPTIKLLYENRDSVERGYLFGGTASEPLSDPLAESQATPGELLHNVPWTGQPTNYFCGPTCGYMILSKLGANPSANGSELTIWNVAEAMETTYYGYTSFTNHMFEKGMNRWLGASIYETVPNPTYEQIRAAVLHSFETGYPVVVDEHEHAGGPHFNGHGDGNYSHIMVIDGYDPTTDAVLFADPAASVYWAGGARKFWYPSLKRFAETYLVPYPWRDGIGMVCPK